MINVNDLLSRTNSKDHFEDEQYWVDLIADMHKYLEEPHPEDERRKIAPIGALERANMILSGIRYQKNQ